MLRVLALLFMTALLVFPELGWGWSRRVSWSTGDHCKGMSVPELLKIQELHYELEEHVLQSAHIAPDIKEKLSKGLGITPQRIGRCEIGIYKARSGANREEVVKGTYVVRRYNNAGFYKVVEEGGLFGSFDFTSERSAIFHLLNLLDKGACDTFKDKFQGKVFQAVEDPMATDGP